MQPAERVIARNEGLGASDAPVALGLSPWRTPFELWREKTGHAAAFEETLPVQVGKALEPILLATFAEKTGLIVTDSQRQFVDEANTWRWATVDGIASDGALVEGKCISWTGGEWGEEGTDQIPLPYVFQVQHGLACTGLPKAYVPVLFEAKRFAIYVVMRDEELIGVLTAREREFWQRVLDNDPPPLTTTNDAKLKYRESAETSVYADAAIAEKVALLKAQREALDAAAQLHDETKAAVMDYMGASAVLLGEDGKQLATWRTAKGRTYIDADGLRKALPDVATRFTKTGAPSRRFLVK